MVLAIVPDRFTIWVWNFQVVTTAFWLLCLAVNVIGTVLIVARLALYRHQLSRLAVASSHVSQLTSITAMVVESELLYSIFIVLYVAPWVADGAVTNVFSQVICPVAVRPISEFPLPTKPTDVVL